MDPNLSLVLANGGWAKRGGSPGAAGALQQWMLSELVDSTPQPGDVFTGGVPLSAHMVSPPVYCPDHAAEYTGCVFFVDSLPVGCRVGV